ncbi:methylamine utilization protein MauE [Pseudomonas aeruginosa]|nr:methylamine utilization protein MauE [Pseudomonas aeruginosa]
MNASVLHLAALAAVVFQALLFLRAAWHKAHDYGRFYGFVADYRLLPEALLGPVSRALIGTELAIVALLLWPPLAAWGALAALALLGLYGQVIASALLRGRTRIECGCGGPAQPLSWLLVARNLGLMGLAALAMFTPPALGGLLATSVALLAGLFAFCLYAIAEQVLANPAPLLARRADPLS